MIRVRGADELGVGIVVAGIVVRGDGRGRLLGYPTANVAVPDDAMPQEADLADGVYAGWLRRADGGVLLAAISLGRRPTYYGPKGARLLEAHALDIEVDLYGEQVEVFIGPMVRSQERFSSSDALVAQIAADLVAVRRRKDELAFPKHWQR
jgi:FAD synthase